MRVLAILLLSTVAAQAVEQSRVDLFLKLVRDNGCMMSDADAGRILPANGFTREEVKEIDNMLIKAGKVDKTKMGMFALTKAACKG